MQNQNIQEFVENIVETIFLSEELQEGLPTLTGIHQEFFKGITTDRLLVLDAEKLLSSSSVIVDQTAEI